MSAFIGRFHGHGGGGHGGGHGHHGGRRFFDGGGGWGRWAGGGGWYGVPDPYPAWDPYAVYGYPPDPYAPDPYAAYAAPDAVSGGWFSSLVHAVASPVTYANHVLAKRIRRDPRLKAAVTRAATAVATAYGGPAAGAAASQLAGPALDTMADPSGDPAQHGEAVKAAAAGDPAVAQAVDAATAAIAQTAGAYAAKEIAKKVSAGDPVAVQHAQAIARSSDAGDPAAQGVSQLVAWFQQWAQGGAASEVSGALGVVGASAVDADALRERALAKAVDTALSHGGGGEAVLFVVSPAFGEFAVPFDWRTHALRYARTVNPRAMSYLAVVDVSDVESPFLLTERVFRAPAPARRAPSQTPPRTTVPVV